MEPPKAALGSWVTDPLPDITRWRNELDPYRSRVVVPFGMVGTHSIDRPMDPLYIFLAAFIRASESGKSRNLCPVASAIAFASAAAVGPWPASPVPKKG